MKNAADGIPRLKMTPHPEGGYFREEYRAAKTILIEGETADSVFCRKRVIFAERLTSLALTLYG